VPVPRVRTFDARPVGVREASAGGAATSGGGGREGAALSFSVERDPLEHAAVDKTKQTNSVKHTRVIIDPL
jgi:hypothetical protein